MAGLSPALQAQSPEIVVEQPVGTSLVDGTAFTNFGSVTVGGSSVLSYTIRNAGAASLTGLAVIKSGRDTGDFTVGSLGATLAAGASTTFTVTFAPSVAGGRSAGLQITSNDADENPFDIALLGALPTAAHALYEWSNFAGQPGGYGNVAGLGTTARFSSPSGVAMDSSGNVYVADTSNHAIRKVSSTGVVTNLAGSAGSSGSANGTGSAARFNAPFGIAVDSSGNVYVSDSANHTIRKVTSTGVVTTLAGTAGSSGSADGTGAAAQFNYPSGVAVDGSGNVFVVDYGNHTIRKVTSAGVVTTLAGSAGLFGNEDGTGSAARFNSPRGLAVDSSGNLYVADTFNNTIRKVTSGGVVTTLAGTAGAHGSTDATGSAARFFNPYGIAIDSSGNLYVADTANHTVRKVTSGGVVTTFAGSAGTSGMVDAGGTAARFNSPYGVAVNSSGTVHVADTSNCLIRKVTSSAVVTTLAGSANNDGSTDATGNAARFGSPFAAAVDGSGNVYVADFAGHTIRQVTSAGVVTTVAGSAGLRGSADGTGSASRFSFPSGIAVDSSGNLYVGDSGNNTIRMISAGGVVTTLAGNPGSTGTADGTGSTARFHSPSGVAVDSNGNVFVADYGNHTIRKVTPAGVVTTFAGSAASPGSVDGIGNGAQFSNPSGVAVDSSGNVYVADYGNHTIRKVTPAFVVTTLAGSAGQSGSADGTGSAARFNTPTGLAVDAAGSVHIADYGNHTIRKLSPNGVVVTTGGVAGVIAGNSGIGAAAQFSSPTGVAVSATGRLYVADSANNRIAAADPLPDLAVEQPAGTELVNDTAATSFGSLIQGGSSVRTFTLKNTGGGTLSGLAITQDGTNAADFTVDPLGTNTLAAGESTTVAVTFTPSAIGARTAALHVASTDIDESPFNINLSGTQLNTSPTISNITDQDINEDGQTGALSFTIGDLETAATALTVSGSSSNINLVPNANIVFGGSGASRTLTVTPAPDANGTVTITVTVSDGGMTATDTFVLTVNPVDDAPFISDIANRNTAEDTSTGAMAFTVSDWETPAADLTLSGSSSNTTLVPNANILFGGSENNRTVTIIPAANQSGLTTITVTVNDGALGASDTFVVIVSGTNDAPTITNIADLTTDEDVSTGALAFTIGDEETPAASLTVTGSSNNTTLVPNANILFGGNGAGRTVTVTPALNKSGTATITVTVSDGVLTATDTFVVTVNSVNDTPTITNIADQTIVQNGATATLAFTIGDVETTVASLTVSGSSSDTTLVPNAKIVFGGSGASRTVKVTPAANLAGTATITIQVSDGVMTQTDTFLLTVNAPEIEVEQPADTGLEDGVSAVDFGIVNVAASSGPKTFTIKNTGQAPLTGIVVTKNGTNQADFALSTTGMSSTLQAGGSTTFTVNFTPAAQGARTAALHIASNDVDENAFDVNLTGSGPVPDIVVEEPVGAELAGGTTLDFGTVGVSGVSPTRTFTIRNGGTSTSTLSITSVTLTGGNTADFVLKTTGMLTTLAQGASTTFTVVFSPKALDARSTTLRILTNDADEGTFLLPLQGTGQSASYGTFAFTKSLELVDEKCGTYTITVTREGGADGAVSVRVNAVIGTASAADHGNVKNLLLSFAAGETSKPVTMTIEDDGVDEPNEDFSLVLSSPLGGAVLGSLSTTTLRIVDSIDTKAPVAPTISKPTANAFIGIGYGTTIEITGIATDNKGVGSVKVTRNNGTAEEAELATPGLPSTTYKLSVVPVTGLNTIAVQSFDTRGNPSSTVTRSFTVLRNLMVTADTASGSVTAGFSPSSYREVGKSLTITATPKPGFVFDGWTANGFTGTGVTVASAELPVLTFIMQENLALTANFIPNPFGAAITGTFNGLVTPTTGTPGVDTVGLLANAVVTGTGAFTSTLKIDGLSLPVAGKFDNTGAARFGTSRTTTLSLTRPGKPSLEVALQLDMTGTTSKISGSVQQTYRRVVTASSTVDADRARYSTVSKVPANLAGTTTKPYTLVFPAKSPQPTGITTQYYPQGDGYATMTVNVNGTVSLTGRLADHTAITASAPLSKAKQWPIYAQLYSLKGCFAGMATLDDGLLDTDVTGADLRWFRPYQNVQWYPFGWADGILVDLIGTKFAVPPAIPAASVFPGLKAISPNATLSFTHGQLSSPISRNMTISPLNVATNVPTAASPTLVIAKTTGIITGSFTHTDGTKPTYQGVILQKGLNQAARGYFMTTSPKVLDYLGESGAVQVLAK